MAVPAIGKPEGPTVARSEVEHDDYKDFEPYFMAMCGSFLHRSDSDAVDSERKKEYRGGFRRRLFNYAVFMLADNSALHFAGKI